MGFPRWSTERQHLFVETFFFLQDLGAEKLIFYNIVYRLCKFSKLYIKKHTYSLYFILASYIYIEHRNVFAFEEIKEKNTHIRCILYSLPTYISNIETFLPSKK